MQQIGEVLNKVMSQYKSFLENGSCEPIDPIANTQRQIDYYNASEGTLNMQDGVECELCKNRGYVMALEIRRGYPYAISRECSCMQKRRSVRRLNASGLAQSVEQYTFDNFRAVETWQTEIKAAAESYCVSLPCTWFFIGGAVGSGKTHICTAIARHFIQTEEVCYMLWTKESTAIKAAVMDDEEYAKLTDKLKTVPVLYIDDFMKPAQGKAASAADVWLAYEILNYRYINKLRTVISSELYLSELMDIDEAIGSRIAERTQGYCFSLKRDKGKNYRLAGGEVL